MGRLKDDLHLAVWKHLKTQPQTRTLLTSLNHPVSGSHVVRSTWAELKTNGKDEGVKKATGLQSVLQERSDLFVFVTTERGHLLIGLTESAQVMDPADGLPSTGPAPQPIQELEMTADLCYDTSALDPPSTATTGEMLVMAEMARADAAAIEAGLAEQAAAVAAAMEVQANPAEQSGLSIEDRPAKMPKIGKGKGKGETDPYKPVWGWNGYQDIVWTPMMAIKKEMDKQKLHQFVRALYKAMDMHGGNAVSLSQLGSDFKVAELKKDPYFKNWRLLDILRDYEDIFELSASAGAAGGMLVKLQPGAGAALPDADAVADFVDETEVMLPERIENPRTFKERMQALRIEFICALHRRGGRTAIQELGQEPRIQKAKQNLHQAKKLIDFVKIFTANFSVAQDETDPTKQFVVELLSAEVDDTSMIDAMLRPPPEPASASKGKGRPTGSQSNSRNDTRYDSRAPPDRDRRYGYDGNAYGPAASTASQPAGPYQPPPVGYHPGYGYPPQPPPGYGHPPPGYGHPHYGAYPPPHGHPPPHHGAPPPHQHHSGYGYPPPAHHTPSGYGGPPPGHPHPQGHAPPQGHLPPSGYPPPNQAPPPGYHHYPPPRH